RVKQLPGAHILAGPEVVLERGSETQLGVPRVHHYAVAPEARPGHSRGTVPERERRGAERSVGLEPDRRPNDERTRLDVAESQQSLDQPDAEVCEVSRQGRAEDPRRRDVQPRGAEL